MTIVESSASPEMERSFNPAQVEPRWRDFWEEHRLFVADPSSSKPPFVMVIPPPNITGRLHVGHGLNNTLQDILARWKRMTGHDVLWIPGSDHASIATHVMIEREMEKEGLTRHDIGREEFLKRAWLWKEKYGGEIADQLRRLGCSCDWSRERFTLDPGLSRAVREVFVRLYEEGLIYRDRYIINWCPRCQTAVSDLEVVHRDTPGKIWTICYKLEGGGEIQVATTRPETILGDVAVAVHPEDERHRPNVGRSAILPVLGRRVPIVADSFVDPAFGTGAVKVTPGHDPNDFAAGRRLGLEPIIVMDERARMTAEAGPYAGMDRFECRERILECLRADGLVIEEKDHTLSMGRCQRCDTIVEPLISKQWFVRIAPLAAQALEAVESGRITIVPEPWRKTYFEWMRNIRDWCISRQLWWGHRIPAWYCDRCSTVAVSRQDPVACAGCGGPLRQDPDILDTWFSSALWAFSTLGWPEKTPELSRYYPTTVLVTGYDIIFFWVARMVMMGMKFMGEIPFHTVFFNGLVRDAKGEKISKTKGNAIDFFSLLDTYGTDAVRFTYASMSSPGSDVALAEGRLEGSRAFATKLWNAVRFARGYLRDESGPLPPRTQLSIPDRWILSRSSLLATDVEEAMNAWRFDEASARIYQFAWHELCDWYLEASKPALGRTGSPEAEASRMVLGHVIDRLLRLLHPIMPFLTEELWDALPTPAGSLPRDVSLAVSPYPVRQLEWEDAEAESGMAVAMEIVGRVRNIRAEMRIAPGMRLDLLVRAGDQASRAQILSVSAEITYLARLNRLEIVDAFTESIAAARSVAGSFELAIPLEGVLDLTAERARLGKEIRRLGDELGANEAKLANAGFVERARPEAVEKVRLARTEAKDRLDRLRALIASLG